jgi:hypothetical protein
MPAKRKAVPQPSTAEQFARARGLKGNAELASAFDIGDAPPRELVKVDYLPDPPDVQVPGPAAPERETALDLDDTIAKILREEAEELGMRLARFGVRFDPRMKQEMIDHGMALLAGAVGGGAIARRQ